MGRLEISILWSMLPIILFESSWSWTSHTGCQISHTSTSKVLAIRFLRHNIESKMPISLSWIFLFPITFSLTLDHYTIYVPSLPLKHSLKQYTLHSIISLLKIAWRRRNKCVLRLCVELQITTFAKNLTWSALIVFINLLISSTVEHIKSIIWWFNNIMIMMKVWY